MVVSVQHFRELTNGYEKTSSGLWTHKGRLSVGPIGTAAYTQGDINVNRGDGTGAYYFGGLGDKFLYFNGSTYNLAGGALNFTPAANSIPTSAIQANAVQQLLGSYFGAVSFTTPGASTSYETPVQVTVTPGGGLLRIDCSGVVYNNQAAGVGATYIGIGWSGAVQAWMHYASSPGANMIVPFSFVYYVTPGAGTPIRYALFLQTTAGTSALWNGVNSALYVNEQKR